VIPRIALLILLVPGLAAGATFDAAADFSASQNPNGAWSYGYLSGSAFTAYASANTEFYGASTWNRPLPAASDTYPLVFYNGSSGSLSYGTGSVLPGELGITSGPEGQIGVIRWTAPEAGLFDVAATFTRDDIGTMQVFVLLNGSAVFDALLNAQNLAAAYASQLTVSAGDTLDFAIGVGTDSSYVGDTADVTATLSAVPLPAGGWLLATGIVALASRSVVRRR